MKKKKKGGLVQRQVWFWGPAKGSVWGLSLEVPDGESVSIPSGDLLSCEGH